MAYRYAGLVFVLAGLAWAQELELQVELLNRVGTESSRPGDPVSARIVSPASLQGSVLEGKVNQSVSGPRSRGASTLYFGFDVLRHGGAAIPIRSRVVTVVGGAGCINVDGQGRIVCRPANPKPSSGTGGLGRALGGAVSGRGARIGGAMDQTAGAAGQASSQAPDLSYAAGSRFVLMANTRSGAPLSAMASAGPAAVSAPAAAAAAPEAVGASTYQPAATAPAAGRPAAASGQPDLVAVKAEFVPGDRVFFYDDFTDMTGDDAPPHWKVRGGTAELRVGQGVRQLTMTAREVRMTPNLTGFPKNFTMETVTKYAGHGVGVRWVFKDAAAKPLMVMRLVSNYTKLGIDCQVGRETITSQYLDMDWTKPIRQELWLQKGRLRLYLNGARVFDANQIELGELASVEAEIYAGQETGKPEKLFGLQGARFAESFPDLGQTLVSSGRYIVRGILFDTDSDRLKAESAAAIKQIAKALEANPSLRVLIEGHTDAVGDAAHNLDLSKRRAEAVKAVLAGQFQIDAGRLSAAGMGATKPVEPNETPQGRAQNRRVELVKL
jgi:OOP family OmpA-OmpF porin